MDYRCQITLMAALIAAVGLVGCVDEEPSMVMHSNVLGDGSFDEGEEGEPDRVGCQFSPEFDEPNILADGRIDLAELAEVGQPLVPESTVGAVPNQYVFNTVVENRLSDSREVGAVSGGDGDGFENLDLDKNDVMIKSADMQLVPADDEFDGPDPLEVRRGSMLVQSAGGISTYSVPILDGSNEVDAFRDAIGEDPVLYTAEVQLQGETLGGDPIESNTIEYPISVCDGCADDGEIFTNAQCVSDN